MITKKNKVQQKIMFWFEHRYNQFESDNVLNTFAWFEDRIHATICALFGHSPERDQCNMPEHDFCRWCNASTPNQAKSGDNVNR